MRRQTLLQKAIKSSSGFFNYFLLIYLLLFLSENLLPGFVSNNFDSTYLLLPVIIFGILASFIPPSHKKAPASKPSDFYLAVGMSVLAGLLIYFKIDLDFYLRLIISLLSFFLILALSVLLITPLNFKLSLPKITFSFNWFKSSLVILLIIFAYFVGHLNLFRLPKFTTSLAPPDATLTIKVLNGSLDDDIAPTFTKLLVSSGYPKAFYGQADNQDYENATIIYPDSEAAQAQVIEKLLEPIYPIIAKQPPLDSSQNEIIIILGNKINYQ